jgi:hypothetical protein
METAQHYRDQATRARRLAQQSHDREISEGFKTFAREYDEIAEDLERGAIEFRHPELMPQQRRRDRARKAEMPPA